MNDARQRESPQALQGSGKLGRTLLRGLLAVALIATGAAAAAVALRHPARAQPAQLTAAPSSPSAESPVVAATAAVVSDAEGEGARPPAVHEGSRIETTPGQNRIKEVTVDELVSRALAENPGLRAARAEADAARGRLLQAGVWVNPRLASNGQKLGATLDYTQIIGSPPQPDLRYVRAGPVGMAELDFEMKRAQVADRWRMLRADARMKAGDMLAAQKKLRNTEELLEVNRHALDLIRERVRLGAAPPLEEGMQLVEVNRLEAGRRILEGQTEILGFQLKAIASLAPEAPLAIRGDLQVAPPKLNREEGLRRTLLARPDHTMTMVDIAMAQAKILEARGYLNASGNMPCSPQTGGGSFSVPITTGNPLAFQGTSPAVDVGAALASAPPLWGGRNQGNIVAAVAEAQAAVYRLDLVTLTIRQEVAAAFTQYEAAQRSLEVYR